VMMVVTMAMLAVVMRRRTSRGVVVWIRRVGIAVAGIGASFGVERRFDPDHARAEPLHHRLDDVIAPDAKTLGHDLGRQMAVAEMPGDPNQMMRIVAPDFDQRLRPALRALLERATAAREVRADVDADDILSAVASLCMSARDDRPGQARRMVALLADGLRHGANSPARR